MLVAWLLALLVARLVAWLIQLAVKELRHPLRGIVPHVSNIPVVGSAWQMRFFQPDSTALPIPLSLSLIYNLFIFFFQIYMQSLQNMSSGSVAASWALSSDNVWWSLPSRSTWMPCSTASST